jgi:hypothetical protein
MVVVHKRAMLQKRRGAILGTQYKAAGKRSANTLTKDDANYNNKEERRGKNDAWDEAEYDDKEDVLPVTDAPFGVRQWDKRHLAEFNTGTVVAAHWLEFMQRAFPPLPGHSIKNSCTNSRKSFVT